MAAIRREEKNHGIEERDQEAEEGQGVAARQAT
jgi:hypothetical protein